MTIYRLAWCATCQKVQTFMNGRCLDCTFPVTPRVREVAPLCRTETR